MGSQAVTVPPLERRWAINVGELGEFGLLARIRRRLDAGAAGGDGSTRDGGGAGSPEPSEASRQVPLGPGDDAAVVAAPDGRVVVSTDLLVQDRHFRLDWSTGGDIGHKAAAQNLADIAAMGARPTALLVGLAVPPDTYVGWLEALVDGLRDEAASVDATVAGGDIVRAEQIMIAVTALGDLAGTSPLTRSGARPGDRVAVAGRLGHAAAGVALLRAMDEAGPPGAPGPTADLPARLRERLPAVADHAERLAALIAAHRRPRPPYALGPAAARLGATSLVDVSDGLTQDLGHVAAASDVVIALDSAAFAVPDALTVAADVVGVDPRNFVLHGGDDHALAGTFPEDVVLPPEWTTIGKVLSGRNGVLVDGKRVETSGWDHFR